MTTVPTLIPRGRAPHRLYLVLLTALVVLIGAGVVLLALHDWGGGTSSTNGVQGSGVAASQSRDLAGFTAVELAGSNNVTVQVGGKQAVIVNADDNLIRRVTTQVRNGRLLIDNAGNFTTKSPMSVYVTSPTLDSASLTGSGVVTVYGVRAEQFTVRVPGSGILNVRGTAARLDATLAGSGDVQLQGLAARFVTATVSGSGRLQVQATRSLDASITGAGAIFYSGNPPKVTQSIMGAGTIIKQ